jgi:hypothetical protein
VGSAGVRAVFAWFSDEDACEPFVSYQSISKFGHQAEGHFSGID